jgi:hypothetical protein
LPLSTNGDFDIMAALPVKDRPGTAMVVADGPVNTVLEENCQPCGSRYGRGTWAADWGWQRNGSEQMEPL